MSLSRQPPLAALLRTLDSSSARLSAILSTNVGVDKFLLTIYYTLKLLYPQVSRVRNALLPIKGPTAVSAVSALAATDVSLRNLAAIVSESRMMARLWGLLSMYRWARGTWVSPPRDADLVWGQIVMCTAYQVLENVAYLAGKGVLRGEWVSPARQGKMWVLSCRFWLVHTVLEAVRLGREYGRLQSRKGEKEEKVDKKEKDAWTRAFWINTGYMPIAMHYSLVQGLMSDEILGACGLVVAYNSFGHLWRQSAVAQK